MRVEGGGLLVRYSTYDTSANRLCIYTICTCISNIDCDIRNRERCTVHDWRKEFIFFFCRICCFEKQTQIKNRMLGPSLCCPLLFKSFSIFCLIGRQSTGNHFFVNLVFMLSCTISIWIESDDTDKQPQTSTVQPAKNGKH